MNRKYNLLVFCLALIIIAVGVGLSHADAEVPRMSKEELKAKLDDPSVVVVDVRRGTDWSASEFKIPGAIYVGKQEYEDWSASFDKDKTLILYCA